MPSPEEFLQQLFHEAEYDPAKRREYYLRTRELKGRRRGSSSSGPVLTRPGLMHPADGVSRPGRTTLPAKAAPKPETSKQTEIETRVSELQARLEKLRVVLRELVKQAKARSGVEPEENKPATSKNPSTPTKPAQLTPQQQAEKEKADKEYYEQHKNEILSEQAKQLETKIRAIRVQIKMLRDQLDDPPAQTAVRPATKPVGTAQKIYYKTGSARVGSKPFTRKENSQNGS